jgi:hypothetical protein
VSIVEILILVVMVGYAVYRQTQRHEVVGSSRFKLAIIYAVVGLVVGGFSRPDSAAEWGLLAASLALERRSSEWRAAGSPGSGRTRPRASGGSSARAPQVTVALFLGMVVAKFGLGTYAYFAHISDDGGFGEILIMIAVMVAFQAELVWRRAQVLGARTSSRPSTVAAQR